MKALDASVELIATSTETQLELEKVLSIVSMYENNLRGYIITRMKLISNRFLEKEIERHIAIIKKLVKDNPARVDDINELSKLVDHRFDLFRRLCYCQKQNFDRESSTLNYKRVMILLNL
jgi:CHASE3 domain sensor protein